MSMTKERWHEAIKAWEKVRDQALLDLEQSEFFMKAIEGKLLSFE